MLLVKDYELTVWDQYIVWNMCICSLSFRHFLTLAYGLKRSFVQFKGLWYGNVSRCLLHVLLPTDRAPIGGEKRTIFPPWALFHIIWFLVANSVSSSLTAVRLTAVSRCFGGTRARVTTPADSGAQCWSHVLTYTDTSVHTVVRLCSCGALASDTGSVCPAR